jgi:hypothetical protein
LLFWLKRRVLSVRSTGTQQFAGVEIFAPNSMAQAPLIFLAPQRVAPIRVMQIQQKIVLQPMPQPMPSGGSLRRNSEPYPGDGSNIYFVIFLSFFGVIFFVISVLPVIFLSFQFWSVMFCHFFGSCFCHFVQFSQKYGKYDRKMTKNDHASRKMQFLQPAKLSFFWSFFGHVFVIWWRFCNLSVICLSFWCNFLKNMEAYQKLFEK